MTIGELARKTGIKLETIRFYERIGLMPVPKRRTSGYRVYGEDDVARLNFIKRAKKVGFSLREIRELLELRVDPFNSCDDVRRKAEEKIADLERKIQEMQRIKQALQVLAASCEDRSSREACPILTALEAVDAEDETARIIFNGD